MTIKTTDLLALAATAAEQYDQYEQAKAQLEESFGVSYNAAKDNLSRDLNIALAQGVDLTPFTGADSRFKFPQFSANIVLRFSKHPTEHAKLTKLQQKVDELEAQLKLAKKKLNNAVEELVLTGAVDLVTDKVTTAYTRIK